MPRILIYTRGDAEFGMGHLHRCSWLLEALRAQGRGNLRVELRCHDTPAARSFWGAEEGVVWLAEPSIASRALLPDVESASLGPGDTCLVDWLEADAASVEAVTRAGARVMLLEAHGAAMNAADLVVNCLTAPLEPAEFDSGRARVYSGAPYLQFSPRLTRLRGVALATTGAMQTELKGPPEPPVRPGVETGAGGSNFVYLILLNFGGSPRPELVRQTLSAIAQTGYDQQVVVMPSGPQGELGLSDDNWPFQVQALPAGTGFYDYLAAADLAICAGGLTAYESAFLGVPTALLALNEHQLDTARKLEAAGCCFTPGLAATTNWSAFGNSLAQLIHNPQLRSEMSRAGQSLTDGRGLLRTVELLLELAYR